MNKQKHYYLYIDDSGSRFPDKAQNIRDDGMDCFALGGILVEKSYKETVKNIYNNFCKKWEIHYPLHSTKIRGARGDFAWLEMSAKKKENFMDELAEFLGELPVISFAAVIDRQGYNNRYKEKYGTERWWMCKTAYCILIERVAKYVRENNGTFEIRFEEVGPKEDRAIVEYSKILKTDGHPFDKENSKEYDCLDSTIYSSLILGEPRRKKKQNLFIQISDLYLYPMVKRKYDENYRPWLYLYEKGKIIDALLSPEDLEKKGIKYSCFDSR